MTSLFQISSPLHPYNGDSSLLLDVKPSKEMENDSKLPDRMSPESKPSAVLINNNTKMDNSATDEAHSDVEMSKFLPPAMTSSKCCWVTSVYPDPLSDFIRVKLKWSKLDLSLECHYAYIFDNWGILKRFASFLSNEWISNLGISSRQFPFFNLSD